MRTRRLLPGLLALAASGGESTEVRIESDASKIEPRDRACVSILVQAAHAFAPGDSPADALLRAVSVAKATKRVTLAEYLRAAIDGDLAKLDRTEMDDVDPDLVLLSGRADGAKGKPDYLVVGWRDATEHRWLDAFLEHWAEFGASLPLPAGFSQPEGAPRGTFRIANLFIRGGSVSESTSSSTFLPSDPALRRERGLSGVFWKNVMETAWWRHGVAPTVPLVLIPEQVALPTAAALLRFYATRFTTYELGPQEVQTPAGPVPLAERFGELNDPLGIAKADLLAVLAHEWLIAKGTMPKTTSDENLAMLVVMSFRALQDALDGKAPPPHEAASALVLNTLRERGAIAIDAEKDRWRVDLAKTRAAVRQLAGEILEVQASGDLARARALVKERGRIGPELRRTLDRVAALPAEKLAPKWIVRGL
ncbi:MAG TPA: hypothetical protein VKE69_04520 [Planctomycetota bacterium]|nr:hypothetical protein [Planctomycetota bacterium]